MINTWGTISDIKEMMELDRIEDRVIIYKFYHIPGHLTVADMATSAGVMLYELSEPTTSSTAILFSHLPLLDT